MCSTHKSSSITEDTVRAKWWRRCRCCYYPALSNPPLPPPGGILTEQLQFSMYPIGGSSPSPWPKSLHGTVSGALDSHFGSTVVIPWPARLNHFPSGFQVKSLPFLFPGKKDTTVSPSPCRGTEDELREIHSISGVLGYARTKPVMWTTFSKGLHTPQCWDAFYCLGSVDERDVEARPPLQSFLTKALLECSTTAPYLH